jgi:hypothetical protein
MGGDEQAKQYTQDDGNSGQNQQQVDSAGQTSAIPYDAGRVGETQELPEPVEQAVDTPKKWGKI